MLPWQQMLQTTVCCHKLLNAVVTQGAFQSSHLDIVLQFNPSAPCSGVYSEKIRNDQA